MSQARTGTLGLCCIRPCPENETTFNNQMFSARRQCLTRLYLPISLLILVIIFTLKRMCSPKQTKVWIALLFCMGLLLFGFVTNKTSTENDCGLKIPSCLLFGICSIIPFLIWSSKIDDISQLVLMHLVMTVELPLVATLHLPFTIVLVGYSTRFLALELICRQLSKKEGMLFTHFDIPTHAFFFVVLVGTLYCLKHNTWENFLKAESLKRSTNEMVERHAEKLKREYFKQMMHELGTPLQVLMLGNDTIAELAHNSKEIIDTNKECRRAIEMLMRLRERVADITRQAYGSTLVPNITRVQVRNLVFKRCRQVMTAYNSARSAGHIAITYKVESNVPEKIHSDADCIWDMLCCLISNAKKYTNEGTVETIVKYDEESSRVIFEVWDTGIGVDPENHKQLFCPFIQFQHDKGGTGLGLFSVKLKAEALGGQAGYLDRAKLDKGPCQGSIFWFSVLNHGGGESRFNSQSSNCATLKSEDTQISMSTKSMQNKFLARSSQGTSRKIATEEKQAFQRSVVMETPPKVRALSPKQGPDSSSSQQKNSSFSFASSQIVAATRSDLYRTELSEPLGTYRKEFTKSLSSVTPRKLTFAVQPKSLSKKPLKWGLCGSSQQLEEEDILHDSHFDLRKQASNQANDGFDTCVCNKLQTFSPNQLTPVSSFAYKSPRKSPFHDASRQKNSSEEHKLEMVPLKTPNTDCILSSTILCDELPPVPRQTILLIEDEKMIAKMITKMLTNNGYVVEVAENGAVGLTKLMQKTYQCVFCDITMPVMDGYETLEKFREWEKAVRPKEEHQHICALSANSDEASMQKAQASGFDNFLSKPASIKILLREIEKSFG